MSGNFKIAVCFNLIDSRRRHRHRLKLPNPQADLSDSGTVIFRSEAGFARQVLGRINGKLIRVLDSRQEEGKWGRKDPHLYDA